MNSFRKIYVYSVLSIIITSLLFMIIWSVSDKWSWPNLTPDSFSLRGFKYIFSSHNNMRIICSSIFLSLVVTVVTLLICIPAARAMAHYEFFGKNIINFLILLPIIFPMITIVMGIHVNFIKWRIANTFLGVVIVHVLPGIPYAVRILQNNFEINGQKIEIQASVLGASRWQVFKYITLPLMVPSLIVSGTIVYILSFSQYFITFLIGGGKILTFSMLLFPFVESGDRTISSALSILYVLSIFLVLFFSDRLVRGYNIRQFPVNG